MLMLQEPVTNVTTFQNDCPETQRRLSLQLGQDFVKPAMPHAVGPTGV
jgi:hypothetical protein